MDIYKLTHEEARCYLDREGVVDKIVTGDQ